MTEQYPAGSQARRQRDLDVGGDPVCWLDRVCPGCGAFRDDPAGPCPRCGEPAAAEA